MTERMVEANRIEHRCEGRGCRSPDNESLYN
jgi:hypothetical protein